ncbi:stage II sporulation protein M [Bombilactobacillus bombi]|uniref:stage II sporulation protein M n=1 Tax=Bombilactobacillus bombi TaxID=1303590 RepID=UPI0015E5C938|nr:stage II sporulation protein M [Bombilactobacillus bombi]MBA1392477.1 stage II sporulation protein M [Lactobacillus sp. XV13L]MBA1434126.1 stage II sporulation protein M [Bombilactobacillus bombi]
MLKYNQTILKRYLKWGWVAFIVISIVFGVLTLSLARNYPHAIHQIMQSLKNIMPSSTTSTQMFWGILGNNERAALIIMLLSLVPLPGFYWLTFGVTSISVGFVLGVSAITGGMKSAVLAFIVGILPHGIFEMSALLLAVALSAQLNRAWRQFLFQRRPATNSLQVRKVLGQYILLVVPLIAVAAVIESFITPQLIHWGTGF